MIPVDATAVKCRYCKSPEKTPCTTSRGFRAERSHRIRQRDSLAVAAHSDPALDAWPYGGAGPCLLCGVEGLGARHRVVDAIAGALSAGEDPGTAAWDYNLPLEAIAAVRAWMVRWDGAWR